MPVFNYTEAIYAALCYIYGDDDNMISSEEKYGMKHNFLQRHHLSNEVMESISKSWSIDTDKLYSDLVESLKACPVEERLEAYRTICITLNNFSHERDDRWGPAHQVKHDIGLSDYEYDRYAKRVEEVN